MRIAMGQFNATVGDLAGNVEKMRTMYAQALSSDVDILVFPELAVCGYPPEDLLLKKHFMQDVRSAVQELAHLTSGQAAPGLAPASGRAAGCPDKTIIVGFAESFRDKCYNSAAVLQAGRISRIYRKALLPNYGVFDERRYFEPGTETVTIDIAGLNIVITICEDIWNIEWLKRSLKSIRPIDLVINISASPFHLGKIIARQKIIGRCAKEFNCAVAYCNLVGGQDELVFDGRSIFADPTGRIVSRATAFKEDLLIAEINRSEGGPVRFEPAKDELPRASDSIEEVYQALVLGTRDYARKNGFEMVMLGLSGGIDSSVTAAIAAAALGAKNVLGISMPSKFNSPETISDAEKLAKNLCIEFHTIPIGNVLEKFDKALSAVHLRVRDIAASGLRSRFGGVGSAESLSGWNSEGIAYENLQARIRGTILMSLSNQFGCLVLTTGNKSETSVGYTTLYGDTAGGFAVIKDVPKTMVYHLAEHINKLTGRQVIPADVMTRPPSAELRPGQKDSDSLPDYELLDKILKGYVEHDKSPRELVEAGLPQDIVYSVIRMVDRNEYKRRLSPPGIRITPKAFGKDRRLPITNRYNIYDNPAIGGRGKTPQ